MKPDGISKSTSPSLGPIWLKDGDDGWWFHKASDRWTYTNNFKHTAHKNSICIPIEYI